MSKLLTPIRYITVGFIEVKHLTNQTLQVSILPTAIRVYSGGIYSPLVCLTSQIITLRHSPNREDEELGELCADCKELGPGPAGLQPGASTTTLRRRGEEEGCEGGKGEKEKKLWEEKVRERQGMRVGFSSK